MVLEEVLARPGLSLLICQGRALLALLSQRLTAGAFALTFVTWSEKSFVFVSGNISPGAR